MSDFLAVIGLMLFGFALGYTLLLLYLNDDGSAWEDDNG